MRRLMAIGLVVLGLVSLCGGWKQAQERFGDFLDKLLGPSPKT